jgi:hypothetical protein
MNCSESSWDKSGLAFGFIAGEIYRNSTIATIDLDNDHVLEGRQTTSPSV